jgi:hypothetical protein
VKERGEDRIVRPHVRPVAPRLDHANVGTVPHLERSKGLAHPLQKGSSPVSLDPNDHEASPLSRITIGG